jgi:cell division protein FtsW
MKRETIWVLNIALTLICLGVLMVYSAKTLTIYKSGDMYSVLCQQLKMVGVALVGLIFFACFDYHHFRIRFLLRGIILGTVVLLVLVLMIGVEKNGSQRWLALGGTTFQPSEIAKLVVIVFLAVKLSEHQDDLGRMSGFLTPLATTGLLAGLVFIENDLGTPVIICAVAILMMFMGGARWRHTLPLVGCGIAGFIHVCRNSPERLARITTFLDPWNDPGGDGYHLTQSLIAFARGAAFGLGPGAGEQKLEYIYAAESDFIFANIGEEMGLAGTLAVLLLFILFLIMGFNIAKNAADLLGSMLAAGIVSLIAMQAAINMAMTISMAPTKGLALPFVSAGGSALIVSAVMVGILVNVGRQAVEAEAPAP